VDLGIEIVSKGETKYGDDEAKKNKDPKNLNFWVNSAIRQMKIVQL
jgi:hypothetical protein